MISNYITVHKDRWSRPNRGMVTLGVCLCLAFLRIEEELALAAVKELASQLNTHLNLDWGESRHSHLVAMERHASNGNVAQKTSETKVKIL